MFSKKPLRWATDLDVIPFTFEAPPADLDWVRCPHCQHRLGLHQPDLQSPARLLGFCEECRGWYLIVMEPEISSALMIVLPENGAFRSAWDSHAGPDEDGRDDPSGQSETPSVPRRDRP